MTNGAEGRARLESFATIGTGISIDVFGTGHISLAYLQKLPANVVKIDRSFIATFEYDDQRPRFVQTMITLLHELGYSVVAKGVDPLGPRLSCAQWAMTTPKVLLRKAA